MNTICVFLLSLMWLLELLELHMWLALYFYKELCSRHVYMTTGWDLKVTTWPRATALFSNEGAVGPESNKAPHFLTGGQTPLLTCYTAAGNWTCRAHTGCFPPERLRSTKWPAPTSSPRDKARDLWGCWNAKGAPGRIFQNVPQQGATFPFLKGLEEAGLMVKGRALASFHPTGT